jgi:hypothetical protein
VLTQSCDLVRRDGPCKASYLTIAAVRPLERAVERYAQQLLRDDLERTLGVGSNDRKSRLVQFVEKVLNNNEPDHFFLHQASDPVGNHCCAFLHLSIALKAHLHYPMALQAKRLQLTESFQHKLGYLVGNSYARIGTEDWVPDHMERTAFDATVSKIVDAAPVVWLDKKIHSKALKVLRKLQPQEQTTAKLASVVEELSRAREQKKREVLETIQRFATELGVTPEVAQILTNRLGNDSTFSSQLSTGA